MKGTRKVDAPLQAETMKAMWVPGVNNLGTFGASAFAEFTDMFEIEESCRKLVEDCARPQQPQIVVQPR